MALFGLLGCADERPAPAEPTGPVVPDRHVLRIEAPRELTTRDGLYRVRWAPVGGEVPVNEHFEAHVDVLSVANGAPVAGARVAMDCFMPDHCHGMLREPRSEEVGGGRYLVRGLLLHMDGYWTVSITVVGADGLAATADDELTL